MGIFDGIARSLGVKMTAAQEEIWREVYGSRAAKSGVTVNWQTALEVTTMLACVRVLADGCSQVPFRLYRDDRGMRTVQTGHPLNDLLYRRPNDWQTSFEFRETLVMHLVMTGNAFVWKGKVGSKRELRSLEPIEPGLMRVKHENDGSLRYFVRRKRGDSTSEIEVPAEDIWHLRGPSWNGWMGLETVKIAREALGLAIATEESQAAMHKDGLQTSGSYSIDGKLDPTDHAKLTKWIKEFRTGGARQGDPLILDRAAKWMSTQMKGVDAQHLETRKFQVEEICRSVRVMPIMVGVPGSAGAYDNGETMFIAHVVHTLMPWYERIEQSADVNLLTPEERRQGFYTKFAAQALMRGTAKDRAEYYSKALGAGGTKPWMTQDEVRGLEDMNPYGSHADELGTGAMDKGSA